MILKQVNSPEQLKKLKATQLPELCQDIRETLLQTVSKTGGHLASNLGVVELTVMLHRVFSVPDDKIIWDVGHQCYVHKLLTGRQERFASLRQKDGLSGFCTPKESVYDTYGAGHSSTSISAALGIAVGEKLSGRNSYTIAVIGDGSMTSGLAYEALNNAGQSGTRLIIILNDNEHSIQNNVGAIADTLGRLRLSSSYYKTKVWTKRHVTAIPIIGKPIYQGFHKTKSAMKRFFFRHSTFLQMGLEYVGPVDGHDLRDLEDALNAVKEIDAPCILHVKTIKGKGYSFAEKQPDAFHGVPAFDLETGVLPKEHIPSFSSVLGRLICKTAAENQSICAISAAMANGTGLEGFAAAYPDRFFDVGIAEEHAVVFAAGLAKAGMVPVVAIYSTFLQRAYDQILHDVGLQDLKVIFAIDRAGLVGADGVTHQGIYDVSYLSAIPQLSIYSPANFQELRDSFYAALSGDHACAIRYPKGGETATAQEEIAPFVKMERQENAKVLLLTYGSLTSICLQSAQKLAEQGLPADLMQLVRLMPLDIDTLERVFSNYEYILVAEESVRNGSVGQMIAGKVAFHAKFRHLAIESGIVPHATVEQQRILCGIDAEHIVKTVLEDYPIE